MKRLIRSQKLKEWMDTRGDRALGDLMEYTGLNPRTIEKMANGHYPFTPNRGTRKALCRATSIPEDDLFPPAPKAQDEEAS